MRLTNAVRDSIRKAAIAKLFHDDIDLDASDNGVIDSKIIDLVVDVTPASIMDAFNRVDTGCYIASDRDVKIAKLSPDEHGGRWYYDEYTIQHRLSSPMPKIHQNGCIYITMEGDRIDQIKDIIAAQDRIAARKEKRDGMNNRIRSVLSSCSTTKQVAEAIPELVPFIPEEGNPLPVPVAVYENLRRDIQALTSK